MTYYYKVSAENVYGESPLSSEVSATPAGLIPPDLPLPTIDNFDRLNENPLSDASRWTNGVIGSAETGLYIPNNWLACSRSTTCTAWRNSAQYGPDSESWARIATLPGTANSVRLYVRIQQPGSTAADGYELRTIQQAGTDQVLLERVDNGTLVTRLTINQELAAGDTLLLRAKGTTIEAWRNDGSSWSRLGLVTDSTYGAGGYTGIGLRGTTGRLEDFGARSLGLNPPGSPSALAATVGDGNAASPGYAVVQRRFADHQLQGVSRDKRGNRDVLRERRHLDDVRRLGTDERGDLLLQGVRRERLRGEPALERGLRDAGRPHSSRPAAADDRQLRPPEPKPALGCQPLDERRHRLGRDRSLHPEQLVGLLEVDDVHGMA